MPEITKNTHIDDWYRYKEPLPRSEWKSSKIMSTGVPVELKSDFVFDEKKCKLCGGSGLVEIKAPRGRKRFSICSCAFGKTKEYWK